MRRFKYLGPDTDGLTGPLTTGQIVEYDGLNATPDGGIPGQFWLEMAEAADGGH